MWTCFLLGCRIQDVGSRGPKWLCFSLLRSHAVFPIPKTRPYKLTEGELNELRCFIRDQLHRGFSVRELAFAIRIGPAVLNQKLRFSIGRSPWRFVQEERIRRAAELLKHSRSSIAELAVQLGYFRLYWGRA